MKRLILLGALLALTLAASAHGGGKATGMVSSSRLVDGGHIRVTASVAPSVQIGEALTLTYRFRNVSKKARTLRLGYDTQWLVVRSADGERYDTRAIWNGFGGPIIAPTTLPPGRVVTRTLPVRVRWSGPLRITPGWDSARLPSVRVRVTSPGAPANSRLAVATVVAATGHLLDHCAPRAAGVPVVGRIVEPRQSAPPMAARCSVEIRRKAGFDLAQVVITTPAQLRAHTDWTYETVRLPRAHGNAEAIAWQFVVTKAGAKSVAAASVDTTRSARKMAPYWEWTSAGPGTRPGGSHCGGSGGGGGGYAGPGVLFVSECR